MHSTAAPERSREKAELSRKTAFSTLGDPEPLGPEDIYGEAPTIIDDARMADAICLMDTYFLEQAKRVRQTATVGDAEADARAVLSILRWTWATTDRVSASRCDRLPIRPLSVPHAIRFTTDHRNLSDVETSYKTKMLLVEGFAAKKAHSSHVSPPRPRDRD